MTPAPARFRRVVVALESGEPGRTTLEIALGFAARRGAELAGLYIEDLDLLHAAALGFVEEMVAGPPRRGPLEAATLERRMRAESTALREVVRQGAERAGIRWSFQTERGRPDSVLASAAASADILLLGKRAAASRRQHAIVSRNVMRAHHRRQAGPPAIGTRASVAVLCEDPAGLPELLRTAMDCRIGETDAIDILLAPEAQQDPRVGAEALGQLLRSTAAALGIAEPPEARTFALVGAGLCDLPRSVRRPGCRLLVLDSEGTLASGETPAVIATALDCAVAFTLRPHTGREGEAELGNGSREQP
jgi:nucleotide-binding universal stress UspA family protein